MAAHMKLDLDPDLFNAVISLLREAPVPHKVGDPVIRALLTQAGDERVQSLEYPKRKTVKKTPLKAVA